MRKVKLLVIGKARHGKDTVCEIIERNFGLSWASSSAFAADVAVYPAIMDKYGYASKVDAYEDRVNHREEWKDLICQYNTPDKARLAREILDCRDVYCGMRQMDEFMSSSHMFDAVIYVDASRRVGGDDPTMQIPIELADYVIDNNGTIDMLIESIGDCISCVL